MSSELLQTLTSSLDKALGQTEEQGYKDVPPLPYHNTTRMLGLVENFQRLAEGLSKYTEAESSAKVIQEGKVDVTEGEVRNTVEHINNLLDIYRGVISSNYKIIKNLQEAACPSKLQVPEEKRADFVRGMKELIFLSPAIDKLDMIVSQLQHGEFMSNTTDNKMTGIFDDALTLFNQLNHNIEILTHTTDKLLFSSSTSLP